MNGVDWLLDINLVIGLLKKHDTAVALAKEQIRRSGMFKLPDAIIAATALMLNAQLLTLDQGMSRSLGRVGNRLEEEAP
ncbi:MAG: hypothetical protein HQL66_13210 [Magnetococcales bacterium]|nr:hypothetical protein [Magnetococcales bacterium]